MTDENPKSPLLSRRDALKIIGLGTAASATARIAAAAESQWVKPPDVEAATIPEPKTISGVETYGHEKPLTHDQVIELRTQLNQHYDQGLNQKDPKTMYLTEFVWADEYTGGENSVCALTGDPDYQSFVRRQNDKMSQVLQTQTEVSGGSVLRRLIVVDKNMPLDDIPYFAINGSDTFKDSNGNSGLWFYRPYVVTQSGYYNSTLKLDAGKSHEEGHYGRPGMPDFYAIDADFTQLGIDIPYDVLLQRMQANPVRYKQIFGLTDSAFEELLENVEEFKRMNEDAETKNTESIDSVPALNGLPYAWLKYLAYLRNDDHGGMWGSSTSDLVQFHMSRHERGLVNRRVRRGNLHDRAYTYGECAWDYVAEFAPQNTLRLVDQSNPSRWTTQSPNETVNWQIYQTFNEDYNGTRLVKTFLHEPTLQGTSQDGTLKLGNPFERGTLDFEYMHEGGVAQKKMIPNTNALILLRVQKTRNGNVVDEGFRYMDPMDFSTGYWENGDNPVDCNHLELSINLGDKNTAPYALDWTIQYTNLSSLDEHIYLSLITK